MKKLLSVTALSVLCVSALVLAQNVPAPPPETQQQSIDSGPYEPVDPSELRFEMEDVYYRSVIGDDGGRPVGGKIGELICNGGSIPLATHEFEDGFIVTKDYGRIKVRTSTSLYSNRF